MNNDDDYTDDDETIIRGKDKTVIRRMKKNNCISTFEKKQNFNPDSKESSSEENKDDFSVSKVDSSFEYSFKKICIKNGFILIQKS